MLTSSHENVFRVTEPLSEESTSHRWIPLQKGSNAVEKHIEFLVMLDAIALMRHHDAVDIFCR